MKKNIAIFVETCYLKKEEQMIKIMNKCKIQRFIDAIFNGYKNRYKLRKDLNLN